MSKDPVAAPGGQSVKVIEGAEAKEWEQDKSAGCAWEVGPRYQHPESHGADIHPATPAPPPPAAAPSSGLVGLGVVKRRRGPSASATAARAGVVPTWSYQRPR